MFERRRYRRGNAVILASSAMVLLGFSAVAVDVSYLRVVDIQLDLAVNAAVLAGAGHVDGTYAGITAARNAAVSFGNANAIMGTANLVSDDNVEFGTVTKSGDDYVFTPLDPSTQANVELINALRVTVDHDGVVAMMGKMAFDVDTLSSRAQATAVRPYNWSATAVECYLPFALPDCNFDPDATTNNPPALISGTQQLENNVGWAHVGGVNTTVVRQNLQGVCSGGEISIRDDTNLMEGVSANVYTLMGSMLENGSYSASNWPTENFPDKFQGEAYTITDEGHPSLVNSAGERMVYVIAGPIPIVDMPGAPGGGCTGDGTWNQSQAILGFTYGFVYDVAKDGSYKAFYLQSDQVNTYDFGTEYGPGAIGNVVDADAPPFLIR